MNMDEFNFNYDDEDDKDFNLDVDSTIEVYNEVDYFSDDMTDTAIGDINAQWIMNDDSEAILEIDPIDRKLLELAKIEVPQVMDRIISRIPGTRRNHETFTAKDFFQAWFTLELQYKLKDWIKSYVPDVTFVDIAEFLQVELLLHFYRISATAFYTPALKIRYQKPDVKYLDSDRYKKIIKALCGTGRSSSISNIQNNSESWTPPFHISSDIQGIYGAFRTSFAGVGFIQGTTWVGLDDDLLRMRSRSPIPKIQADAGTFTCRILQFTSG